jgi:hypothetical protein
MEQKEKVGKEKKIEKVNESKNERCVNLRFERM